MRTRRFAFPSMLLFAALIVACGQQASTSLIRLPPPGNWERDLLASRASKDEYFRTSKETPLLAREVAGFRGLEYFEPDRDYYFVGRVEFYERPEPLEIATTSGKIRPAEKVGRVTFPVDGTTQTLQVYRLLDNAEPGFFLPFTDATSGAETYPTGRYVELNGPAEGPWVLDFNRAYNPSCAYGDPARFACPVTPPANRLEVAIRAGERGYRETEDSAAAPGTPEETG